MSVVSLKYCIIPPELYPLILLCPNVRSQLSKSIYMSGSKKPAYQGVFVLWMNFQVCNETCTHWHFKLKEEESHCPARDCFQLLPQRSSTVTSCLSEKHDCPCKSDGSCLLSHLDLQQHKSVFGSSRARRQLQPGAEQSLHRGATEQETGTLSLLSTHLLVLTFVGNQKKWSKSSSKCFNPKAIELSSSHQAWALVKARLAQGLLHHIPLHNKCT